MVLLAALFGGIFYYVFFVPKEYEALEEEASAEIQDSTYQEYREYVSDTNKGIRNLLDGEQLEKIIPSNYPNIDLNLPRTDNPFARSF
jgi:hypothetical protein